MCVLVCSSFDLGEVSCPHQGCAALGGQGTWFLKGLTPGQPPLTLVLQPSTSQSMPGSANQHTEYQKWHLNGENSSLSITTRNVTNGLW